MIRIAIPPLRERSEDLPLLIEHFLDLYSRQHAVPRPQLSGAARERLASYRWPGNIRELKNVVERMVLRAQGRAVGPEDLPADVRPDAGRTASPAVDATVKPATPVADELAARMLHHGESFWTVVYPVFASRDITRADLRRIVQIGLETTKGNYRVLVEVFNLPREDYKRFLGFLRKHDCHLPYQRFRAAPVRVDSVVPRTFVASGKR